MTKRKTQFDAMERVLHNVDAILEERGLTRRQLADMLDMDESNLSKMLRNVNSPRVCQIQRLADALQVDISEVFKQPDLVHS